MSLISSIVRNVLHAINPRRAEPPTPPKPPPGYSGFKDWDYAKAAVADGRMTRAELSKLMELARAQVPVDGYGDQQWRTNVEGALGANIVGPRYNGGQEYWNSPVLTQEARQHLINNVLGADFVAKTDAVSRMKMPQLFEYTMGIAARLHEAKYDEMASKPNVYGPVDHNNPGFVGGTGAGGSAHYYRNEHPQTEGVPFRDLSVSYNHTVKGQSLQFHDSGNFMILRNEGGRWNAYDANDKRLPDSAAKAALADPRLEDCMKTIARQLLTSMRREHVPAE